MSTNFCVFRRLLSVLFIFICIRSGLSQSQVVRSHSQGQLNQNGCNKVKICLHIPRELGNFISIKYLDKDLFEYILSGETDTDGYVALGLSKDPKMGNDGVFACIYNKDTDTIDVIISKNDGRKNYPLTNPEIEVNKIKMEHTNGHIFCKFQTKAQLNFENVKFDLENEKVFLLIARGPSNSTHIKKHLNKIATTESVNLTMFGYQAPATTTRPTTTANVTTDVTEVTSVASDVTAISLVFNFTDTLRTRTPTSTTASVTTEIKKKKDKTWIKLHAVFMIIAWIFFLPIGAMVSRFFKETWTDIQIFGRRFWFWLHIGCMISSFVFASLGCIFIAENRGYFFLPDVKKRSFAHCIMGLVAVGLMTINILSFWFPFKTKIKKNVQFIFHFVFGVGSFYIGVINIALTPTWLGQNSILPCYTPYAILIWCIIHLLIYLLISSLITIDDHSNFALGWMDYEGWRAFSVPMRMVYAGEAPGSTLRKCILLVNIMVSLIMAILLSTSVKNQYNC